MEHSMETLLEYDRLLSLLDHAEDVNDTVGVVNILKQIDAYKKRWSIK